jgi:serine/threonine-protein kinase
MDDRSDDQLGDRRVGAYALGAPLGSGGAATVYRATAADGRAVALKLLSPAGERPHADDLARFDREIGALERIRHPNVIALIDRGVDATRGPYLVTPLVAGRTLRELAGAPLSPEVALVVLHFLASGLTSIHGAGLVHRDVKPENAMLTDDGRLLIIDLGLALDPEHTRYTQEGAVAGSVPYMAPEQIEGGAIVPASDVWSLGVIAHELVTGRRPFQRERQREEVAAILAGRYAPLSDGDRRVSAAFEDMVARMLQLDAARRPADARAALAMIDRQIDWVDAAAGTLGGGLDGELAAIAESPQRYAEAIAPLLATTIANAAQRALDAGDPFRGVREIDRGLAYAPGDARLTGMLSGALASQRAVAAAPARRSRRPWLIGGAVALALASGGVAMLLGGGVDVDYSDPASVTASIFEAARTGHTGHLSGLCDPLGENDGDTRRICEMTTDSDDWREFQLTFQGARVLGQRVGPARAEVEFSFGPAGSRTETMNLVRRGDRWYLASF